MKKRDKRRRRKKKVERKTMLVSFLTLCLMSLLLVTIVSSPLFTEDFTTYDEFDENENITIVNSTRVTFIAYRNEDAYLYYDYEQNYFGNFTIEWKARSTSSDHSSVGPIWGLAYTVDDYIGIQNSGNSFISVYLRYSTTGSPNWYMLIRESSNGTPYSTGAAREFAYNNTQWYWFVANKTATSLNVKVYNDKNHTNLVHNINHTLQQDYRFRYIYACNTFNSSSNEKIALQIENYNVTIIPPPPPNLLTTNIINSATVVISIYTISLIFSVFLIINARGEKAFSEIIRLVVEVVVLVTILMVFLLLFRIF